VVVDALVDAVEIPVFNVTTPLEPVLDVMPSLLHVPPKKEHKSSPSIKIIKRNNAPL
jgi:hypothetical protein